MALDLATPATPVLLPQELFLLANDHERQEMHRYRQLAFRFLTFGFGISHLMAAFGIECEQRLEEVREAMQRLAVPFPCTAEVASRGVSFPPFRQIHLITDRGMAMDALTRATAVAERSQRFSEQLRDGNVIADLDPMLAAFVEQKRRECRILRETREACEF